jgi:proline racemase
MAVLHARGLMRIGDAMTHASPIGSTFEGRIVAETGDGKIVPAIRGSGFVTGRLELYVDERDPFPEGYLVRDTWPGSDLQ